MGEGGTPPNTNIPIGSGGKVSVAKPHHACDPKRGRSKGHGVRNIKTLADIRHYRKIL